MDDGRNIKREEEKEMKKLMKLMESQIIRYIVTGVLTTGINYLMYFALTALTADYLTANSIAWVGAVIFAFFANRSVVFHSCGNRGRSLRDLSAPGF